MNQACLYHRANEVQRHDAEEIIIEYAKKIEWRLDGCDALLDVGCGSGDVLMDFIYPIMPKQFERIVGTDISDKMIKFAKSCYNSYPQCDFKQLDIASEDKLPTDLVGAFDHVTSFYCLHWVQDQRQALNNIYRLLHTAGGDCLLVFLAANPIYDVYKILSKSIKWSFYMQDVDSYISPLHYSPDPQKEFSQMLKEAGFENLQVELREKVYVYEGLEILKDNVKAVCPFLDRIPWSQHDDFLEDFINIVTNLDLRHSDVNESIQKFNSPYKLLVAYAKKPSMVPKLMNDFITSDRHSKNIS
ncbi:juvenile hormone acid O-methyltransferase [Stomoxys calcitrans]|uniref:juvenile hormone acid O-methyltransferase n=1 Tax=Stomoxys calcitrans TaxID=35570 RepID=UPI0027E2778A|nr:juvenile hormone acid O-methyltransferase [Stomoxys calcitrans]